MAVFRIEKTRDYTVMSNHHLKDRTLTLKSKGLLSMMLSLPDEWNYTTRGLAAICREGVDSIGAALKELETHGYIRRTQLRDEKGKITDTEYVIYEMPQCEPPSSPGTPLPGTANPYTENPDMGIPDTAEPCTEKPAQLNTNQTKTDLSSTEISNPTMNALSICIMLVIYGRMIEVYLTTSVGPIPLATMTNRDWSHTGQNYLKSLFALAFQAFLIMVCVGIYSVLVQSIATDGNISGAIWACMGYTVLLCFALFKTGSLSKSLFGAH